MLRNRRYKICVYHDLEIDELFDLTDDPSEFRNLWDDPAHRAVRDEMLRACFEATVTANLPNMPILDNADEARRKIGGSPTTVFYNTKDNGVWTSNYEDGDRRLIVRHDAGHTGSVYDLRSSEPDRDRWNERGYREARFRLIKKCFDAFVFSIDAGPPRIGRY
jgi:hypothetical protein